MYKILHIPTANYAYEHEDFVGKHAIKYLPKIKVGDKANFHLMIFPDKKSAREHIRDSAGYYVNTDYGFVYLHSCVFERMSNVIDTHFEIVEHHV